MGIEVNEAYLKRLQQAAGLLDTMLKNPKTKLATEQTIKALHPSANTTLDYAKPFIDRMVGIEKKIDGFIAGQQAAAIDSKLEASFEILRKKDGYTEEGIEKLKELMVARKIPDPMDAAVVMNALNPPKPTVATGFGGTGWNIGAPTEDKDLALLFKDPDAWADQEIARIQQERIAT